MSDKGFAEDDTVICLSRLSINFESAECYIHCISCSCSINVHACRLLINIKFNIVCLHTETTN